MTDWNLPPYGELGKPPGDHADQFDERAGTFGCEVDNAREPPHCRQAEVKRLDAGDCPTKALKGPLGKPFWRHKRVQYRNVGWDTQLGRGIELSAQFADEGLRFRHGNNNG